MGLKNHILIRKAKPAQSEFLAEQESRVGLYSSRFETLEGTNQDSAAAFFFEDGSCVFAVADGLGGLPSGEAASSIALECLHEAIKEAESAYLRSAILNGIESANRKILADSGGAGTTLAVVEITEEGARPYHVGDSVIYQFGGLGKIKFQSISHSPVGYALAAGILDESAAIRHDDLHLISNMLGSEEMRIEIGPALKLSKKDAILLATDGLTDNLLVDEISEIIRKGTIDEAVLNLATLADHRMAAQDPAQPSKPDDCTFILYRPAP